MVWAAFCSVGKLELRFTSTKMDGREYQDVLSHSLLPFLRRFRRLQLRYQQDNAGVHTSKNRRRNDPGFVPMMEWFQDQGINLLDWPSCSPDLNPVEYLWGILVRRIYANNRQYQTVQELKNALQQAWNNIDNQTIQNLVQSMPNRIFQVIERRGGVIDY